MAGEATHLSNSWAERRIDNYYMVPGVDGNDKVWSVKTIGVDHIMTLAATDVPPDIERRFPQAEGFRERLARPARGVEMLIGMDNQGWMPKRVGSSKVEGDNLRLIQSMLSTRCILMGSAKAADPGDGTQGSAGDQPRGSRQQRGKRLEPRLADCVQVMMAMTLVMLAGMPECMAFRAYDCNNQSAQIEQYLLLDPEPCGSMEKVHAIERELYVGEITQIKKKRLVQITKCTASQMVKSSCCGVPEPLGCGVIRQIPRPDHDRANGLPASCQDGAVQAQREGLPVRDERQEFGDCQPHGRSGQQQQLQSGPV